MEIDLELTAKRVEQLENRLNFAFSSEVFEKDGTPNIGGKKITFSNGQEKILRKKYKYFSLQFAGPWWMKVDYEGKNILVKFIQGRSGAAYDWSNESLIGFGKTPSRFFKIAIKPEGMPVMNVGDKLKASCQISIK